MLNWRTWGEWALYGLYALGERLHVSWGRHYLWVPWGRHHRSLFLDWGDWRQRGLLVIRFPGWRDPQ